MPKQTKKNYLTKHTVYVELTLSWLARMYEYNPSYSGVQEEEWNTHCIFDRIFPLCLISSRKQTSCT